MSLLLAGVDEAGYGPLLGPLCVGLSVFRIRDWNDGDPAPDLWSLLASAVSRSLSEAAGRITVADSKKLKSSSSGRKHPLANIERGLLPFARLRSGPLADDAALFASLGFEPLSHPCYHATATPLPLAATDGVIGISANALARALDAAGIELVELRCLCVDEDRFNQTVRTSGTKAQATLDAVTDHLQRVLALPRQRAESVRVVCDRLGGRTSYSRALAMALELSEVRVLEESESRSRYSWTSRDASIGVAFQIEAESHHLPVALASMAAKLCRELAMARFNTYWRGVIPELKPTAGYWEDGQRWLSQAGDRLPPHDRTRLVRIA